MTQMFDFAALAQPAGTEFAPGAQELVVETEPASPKVWAEAASDRLGDLSDALEAAAARLQETAVEQRVTPQTPLQLPPVAEPARVATPLPPVVRELIDVMIAELPEVDTALATFVGLSQAKGVDADVVKEAFERAAVVVERFGAASASVGFKGLEQVCTQVGINCRRFRFAAWP